MIERKGAHLGGGKARVLGQQWLPILPTTHADVEKALWGRLHLQRRSATCEREENTRVGYSWE
jgi:hypothetical protein